MLQISSKELKLALGEYLSEVEDINYLLKSEIALSSMDDIFITNEELEMSYYLYDDYSCDDIHNEHYNEIRGAK